MIRPILVSLALVLGVGAVMAQGDPIAERQKIMKGFGDATKAGAAMVKGEAPFDLAKAKAIFATYQKGIGHAAGLFPENSKTGHDTEAAPKIWEDMAGFKAAAAKLDKDAAAAEAAVTDLASFKTQFAAVTKDCGGCHDTYRLKKK